MNILIIKQKLKKKKNNSQRWKQCPSVNEWINKMWYIHVRAYYPAVQRKNIVTHAPT
jgi:hypothetical protein